jgi:peptide/nickel transport system substrate-binding protein
LPEKWSFRQTQRIKRHLPFLRLSLKEAVMPNRDMIDRIVRNAEQDMRAGRLSRRDFLRLSALLGISTGSALALAACGGGTTAAPTTAPGSTDAPAAATSASTEGAAAPEATAAPTEGTTGSTATGTLRVGSEIPVNLDPANASADAEILILNSVYDYLVDIDSANQIQPRLATEWTVSEDGLAYTFALADGVTFHDGSPLTAADVVWTFDRLRDASLELPTADLYSNIDAITAEGDNQVVFTLNETNPFFLYDLSDNHALIVKAEANDLGVTFNGTGPFKVVDYQPEDRITLEANPSYFMAGKPGVSNLEIIFFADQVASVDALRSGQIDLVMRMPTALYQTLQSEPGVVASAIPTNGFDLVRLRSDREPGNNPQVIQAMKLATDRQAIFDTVTLGLGAIGRDSPIGPLYTTYYTEDTPIPARDVEAARALLAEAGYGDGLTIDIHVPDSGDRPDLAAVLKEQWAEAGIDINIIVEPENVYYGDNGWLEVDLGITGWGSRPVPQFYLDVMLVTDAVWNEAHFSDAEFDALAQTAGTTLDEDERVTAYAEIQRILIERGPIIIPYFFAQLGAIRDTFTGFDMKAFPGRTDLAAITAA